MYHVFGIQYACCTCCRCMGDGVLLYSKCRSRVDLSLIKSPIDDDDDADDDFHH